MHQTTVTICFFSCMNNSNTFNIQDTIYDILIIQLLLISQYLNQTINIVYDFYIKSVLTDVNTANINNALMVHDIATNQTS